MKDITDLFGKQYVPKSALLFYQEIDDGENGFVEHYDISEDGQPFNPHPITVLEANRLAKAFTLTEPDNFLNSNGLIPENIISISFSQKKVVWYTKQMDKDLLFTESSGIKSGNGKIPPLLWSADKDSLSVYALKSNRKPNYKTVLYHAPFLNIYKSGIVCMGTVDVSIKESASLLEFINAWENHFFNSYFSHLMSNHNPIDDNLITVWNKCIKEQLPFPLHLLIKSNKTIQSLCHE